MLEISYTRVGDYLLPNITLSETPPEITAPLGRYARMRRAYLRDHRPILYNQLLLSERLYPHLRDVDETALERQKRGVPEEVILSELVCE